MYRFYPKKYQQTKKYKRYW